MNQAGQIIDRDENPVWPTPLALAAKAERRAGWPPRLSAFRPEPAELAQVTPAELPHLSPEQQRAALDQLLGPNPPSGRKHPSGSGRPADPGLDRVFDNLSQLERELQLITRLRPVGIGWYEASTSNGASFLVGVTRATDNGEPPARTTRVGPIDLPAHLITLSDALGVEQVEIVVARELAALAARHVAPAPGEPVVDHAGATELRVRARQLNTWRNGASPTPAANPVARQRGSHTRERQLRERIIDLDLTDTAPGVVERRRRLAEHGYPDVADLTRGHTPPRRATPTPSARDQKRLEELLREKRSDRYAVAAHPNRWRELVAGAQPGRHIDGVIAAIETFRGRPTTTEPIGVEALAAMTRLVDYTGAQPQLLADTAGLSDVERDAALRTARRAAERALGDAGPSAYRADIRTYADGSRETVVAFNVEEELAEFLPPTRDDVVTIESLLVDGNDVPVPIPGRPLGPSLPADRPVSPDYFHYLADADRPGQTAARSAEFADWSRTRAPARPVPVRDARLALLHERADLVGAAAGVTVSPGGVHTFGVCTPHGRRFTAEVRLGNSGPHAAVTTPAAAEDLGYFVIDIDDKLSPDRVLMLVADQVARTAARVDLVGWALAGIDAAAGHDPAVLAALRSAAHTPARSVAAVTAGGSASLAVEDERAADAAARDAIDAARAEAAARGPGGDVLARAAEAVEQLRQALLAPDALSLDTRIPDQLSLADRGPIAQLTIAAELLQAPNIGWRPKRSIRRDLTDALGPMGLTGDLVALPGTSGHEQRTALLPTPELRELVQRHGHRGLLTPVPEAGPALDRQWLQALLGREEFRSWVAADRIALLAGPEYGTQRLELGLADGHTLPVSVRLGEPSDPEDPAQPAPERDSEAYRDADGWHITIQPGLSPSTARRELAGQLAVIVGTTQDARTAGVDTTDEGQFRTYVNGVRGTDGPLPWRQHWINGYLRAFVDEYDAATGWVRRQELRTELRRDVLPSWNLAKRRGGTGDALGELPPDLRERIAGLRGHSTRWAADPKPRLDVAKLAQDIATAAAEPALAANIGAASIHFVDSAESRALGFAGEDLVGLRIVTEAGNELVVSLQAGPLDGVGGHLERLGRQEEVPESVAVPVRYVARLFQRQSPQQAALALHYLLGAARADVDARPGESSTTTELDTLPTGRDQVANSPGNVALLNAIRSRYRTARGFRTRRALRSTAWETVRRLDPATVGNLEGELATFVGEMLNRRRPSITVDEDLDRVRAAVAQRRYPSRVPPLGRYLRKRLLSYGTQGLAGLGLAFYFHHIYANTVAPFIHFGIAWTPSQLTFSVIGVALGFAAGLVRAFADHRTYSAAEAADLRRRAAEERRLARSTADPTGAFGATAANTLRDVIADVRGQLEAATQAEARIGELLSTLQPRVRSGEVTGTQLAAAMHADPVADAPTRTAPPGPGRRVQPSPWAYASRKIPGRTPEYRVYFAKNFMPTATKVITSLALSGFGAGQWVYASVVALGNATRFGLDPLTRMGQDYFKQINTSTRRQQERATKDRHARSREAAAAKTAAALFLDVPAVRTSLAWADATRRLVAALEDVADPTTPTAAAGRRDSTALRRVDLVPPSAAPLHKVLRMNNTFQALIVATPAELIAGFGPGIPALWINGPAGATQIGTAILSLAMTVPGDTIGFQKFYEALDRAHTEYALELEQERHGVTVAFTHSSSARLAERIEAAVRELPADTARQVDGLRSEIMRQLGHRPHAPSADSIGPVIATYAPSHPAQSMRPPFRHQLWRDLPSGVAQAALGIAIAALWPGLAPAVAQEQGITAATQNGLSGVVQWLVNGVSMTDEVNGYNAQLLYERLMEIQEVRAAAQAHLLALQPALDEVAAEIVEHQEASVDVLREIRDALGHVPRS